MKNKYKKYFDISVKVIITFLLCQLIFGKVALLYVLLIYYILDLFLKPGRK